MDFSTNLTHLNIAQVILIAIMFVALILFFVAVIAHIFNSVTATYQDFMQKRKAKKKPINRFKSETEKDIADLKDSIGSTLLVLVFGVIIFLLRDI